MPTDEEKARARMQGAGSATEAALRDAASDGAGGKVALLEALRKSDVHPEIANRLGALLSGAHVVANRDRSHEAERLSTRNEVERIVAERDSGRLCNGDLLRIAQGKRHEPPRPEHPPEQKRKLRAGAEVAADLMSLGDGKGIDALTTASAQASVDIEDGDADESDGARERVGRLLS